jgi:rifampicin phosphotransferase
MNSYVFRFEDIDKTNLPAFGGKGANLGELSRIEGIRVPTGFCVSTDAFKRIIEATTSINELLDQLSLLKTEDRDNISRLSGEIRRLIEAQPIPQDINDEITRHLLRLDQNNAYAIRSSATEEDSPTASFAGQHDTHLNIIGAEAILRHISKCWASLFTVRAITYRLQNGIDHSKVRLAVVVQRMVFADASGILFTADPVTSNRKVSSIDASFGLGEAVVSGLVNPDIYKVRSGKIVDKKLSAKKLVICASKDGGTNQLEIEPEKQNIQALSDEQILELERLGRKIEEHFGSPQDIEWCLADETFYVVQSRPITTLFPIPDVNDHENHVFISVGHQQMMTDALKPLGLSLRQLTSFGPMFPAAGRQFVDVTRQLSSSVSRENLLKVMGQHDPLIKDALVTIIEREDFIKPLADDKKEVRPRSDRIVEASQAQIENDPTIVTDLIQRTQTSIEDLRQNIRTKSGTDLFDFILEDFQQSKPLLFGPQNMQAIMASINASSWIDAKMQEWLGELNVADTLSQSVPNNITSEMGLALLDVADVIRPHREVIEYLQHVKDDDFLEQLVTFDGGHETLDAIETFLDKYGMRCAGEIDITKDRWIEKPTTLVPLILSNVKNFEPGAGNRKFEEGRREALKKEQDLLERLRQLPTGEQKAEETREKISLLRNFAGYREYPKYGIVNRYWIYKQALLKEVEKLVQAGIVQEKEDVYFLTFEELREVVRTSQIDYQIIRRRKDEFAFYEKLTPPRVITSDGEIVPGDYKRENLPADALVGLAVSSGVVEGRARVILNLEDADLEGGDILVTRFTDPGWTPLFVIIKGLVTEVGGMNTHGAVIAREYGLPAVVGVESATRLIKDGQRIRVNGTEGYVEIL